MIVNNKRRRIYLAVVLVMILATLTVIFGSSLNSQEKSASQSGAVVEVVKPIVDSQNKIPEDRFEYYIRKLGHFSEFFILALELCFLYGIIKGKNPVIGKMLPILFAVLLCAVIDETIQIYSGRGSSLKDVWIDTGGGVFAMTLFLAVNKISQIIKPEKTETDER